MCVTEGLHLGIQSLVVCSHEVNHHQLQSLKLNLLLPLYCHTLQEPKQTGSCDHPFPKVPTQCAGDKLAENRAFQQDNARYPSDTHCQSHEEHARKLLGPCGRFRFKAPQAGWGHMRTLDPSGSWVWALRSGCEPSLWRSAIGLCSMGRDATAQQRRGS